MRSLAFVVMMLTACGGKPTPAQQPKPEVKSADCGQNGCDKPASTEPVQATTCDTPPCVNELTRRFNETAPPNPCGDNPKPCDNDPSCGGVHAAKRCDSPPCD